MVEVHQLLDAVNAGDSTVLSELLRHVPPAEGKAWIRKALLRSAYDNRCEAVEALLDVKAETDGTDDLGLTPLHWAARQGHQGIAKALLAGKANARAVTVDGTTPLHLAMAANAMGIIELLLHKEHGAQVDAVTRTGCTCLHSAAETGAAAAITVLLDRQPIPSPLLSFTTERGETPLARACARGHFTVVTLLLRNKAKTTEPNWWGQFPLHLAAGAGHVPSVEALLNKEAEVNATANDGATALHCASERNQYKVVQVLLAAGADFSLAAAAGRLPLHVAAERGSRDAVEELLNAGCDHGVLAFEDRAPLSLAAQRGHTAVVKLLLDSKADPQTMDTVKQTALHATAITGKHEAGKLLVDRGARVMQKDSSGRTPLDLAIEVRSDGMIRLLLKSGAELPEECREDESLLPLVREVEREIIQEQLASLESGSNAKEMRNASVDFEEARQRMLRLAAEGATAQCSMPLGSLDKRLQDATELAKASQKGEKELQEALEKITRQVGEKESDLENAKKQLKSWKLDMASMRTENKNTMEEFNTLKTNIAAAQSLEAKALEAENKVYPEIDAAKKKGDDLDARRVVQLEEADSLRQQLEELRAQLDKWHEEKERATRLHAQAQACLLRTGELPAAAG